VFDAHNESNNVVFLRLVTNFIWKCSKVFRHLERNAKFSKACVGKSTIKSVIHTKIKNILQHNSKDVDDNEYVYRGEIAMDKQLSADRSSFP
jgi:hypothetical protein